jgi:hypothetical protein
VATGRRRSEVRVREREVGVGKRPRALAIFREQRGGFAKLPGGGVLTSGGGRARAARRVSRVTWRGGETGAPFKNFDRVF